jgi:hypothetical protein
LLGKIQHGEEKNMAKIVYGVSGEGPGHSSRAREMLTHLQQLGHIVKVVSYDRGYTYLKAALSLKIPIQSYLQALFFLPPNNIKFNFDFFLS